MAITREQLVDLGFKPSKRGGGLSKYKKYDTLIYPINETDFLYIGYNQFNKTVNNKIIWKSFKSEEGRITYPVISLGDTGYKELKSFISRCKDSIVNVAIPETLEEAKAPNAHEEGSVPREIEDIPTAEDTRNAMKSCLNDSEDGLPFINSID